MKAVSTVALALLTLGPVTLLTGCARNRPQTQAPTYKRRGAPAVDLDRVLLVIAPISVEGLPGAAGVYETVLNASLLTGRRGVSLQGARRALVAAGHPAMTTADLAERLYDAASRGSSRFPDEHALLGDIVALARRLARSRRPGDPALVVALRVRGIEARGGVVSYRVTAAIYDVRRRALHAVTSFTRATRATSLLDDLGNLGLQLLPQLARGA